MMPLSRFVFGVVPVFMLLIFSLAPAWAGGMSCTIPSQLGSGTSGTDVEEYATQPYCYIGPEMCCDATSVPQITQDIFDGYRKLFVMDSFYTCPVEIDLQNLSDELRNVKFYKTAAYGAFIDASVFLDTLRALQVVTAQSFQTYTPSEQICRFGTLTRSLSASEGRVDANRLVLSEIGLARNLGTVSSVASAGRGIDNQRRLQFFINKFCDLTENNSGLTGLCQVATPVSNLNYDRDVDFTRTADNEATLNVDFTNTSLTFDESNVIGLGHYLYGHRQPSKRISYADMDESAGSSGLYREYRSVIARRAAAQNSYNTFAAMKAAGSGASDTYMKEVLAQLGLSGAEADIYIGDKDSKTVAAKSSYSAQMEILTKRLYQNPAFYANLMESKTNVRRTSAAIQGVGLMQGRDIYRSMERSEMLLAIMVELEARKMVNNNQGAKGQ